MSALPPRSFKRSLLTSYLQDLQSNGLLPRVRATASAGLGELIDHPGATEPWIPAAPVDEINAAVAELGGREAVRQLGLAVMKSGFVKVLEPIIHLSLSLFGGTPASLFLRAPLMLAVVSRGVEMKWTATSRTGGTMKVVCGDPVPLPSWAAWEGTFLHILELAGVTGTVGEARPAADGRSCEIEVAWTPK